MLNYYFNLEHIEVKTTKAGKGIYTSILPNTSVFVFTIMVEGREEKVSKLVALHLELLSAALFSKCWHGLLTRLFEIMNIRVCHLQQTAILCIKAGKREWWMYIKRKIYNWKIRCGEEWTGSWKWMDMRVTPEGMPGGTNTHSFN